MAYKEKAPLPISEGGTNAISMANTDGVVYYDGTQLVTTAVGTATNVLTSNGAGMAPTFQALGAANITITGDTGGAQTATSFTFTGSGSTSGLYFAGAADTFTTSFQGATINAGAVNIGTDSATNTIDIGTATSTGRTINIGNTTGTTGIVQNVGTGNFVLDGVTNSTYGIGASTTTGTITIGGSSQSGSITIGQSANTIFLNSSSSAASIRIAYNQTAGSVFIGHSMTTGTISIGSTAAQTGTIDIAPGTGAQIVNIAAASTGVKTVNIASGSVANIVTIGSTTGAASLTLNSGSLGIIATGVSGVAVANKNYVTINTSTGALGSDAGPASSITITGDSGGGLTGSSFTFTGGTTGLTFAGAGTTETLGGTLAIANGGTNATSMANTDGVVYYDGTRLVTTAVGTATQVLTSNGAGVAPTFQAAPGTGFSTATLNLTNSQIKNLHGTPVTAISNPGSGKTIQVLGVITKMVYGGTNIFTAGASQTISAAYASSSGTTFTNSGVIMSNANIVNNASTIQTAIPANVGGGAAFPATNLENQPIVVYNPVATEISGNAANDNTITVIITYVTHAI